MRWMDDARRLPTRLAAARLHLLATTSVARQPLAEAVDEALRGGATVVQVREKEMSD